MGRALVIKGADFSAVKIEDVSIDGRKYLSRNNPLLIKSGYIASSTGQWVTSSNTQSYFWPVSEGDYLVSRGNMTFKTYGTLFYFVTIENGVPTFQKVGGDVIGDKNFIISKAPTDGYVVIIAKDNDSIIDFPETFITPNIDSELMNDLQIIKEHKIHDINGWLKSDGSWGSGAHSYSYPVLEGEQLEVKALANSVSLIGLYSRALPSNTEGSISYPQMNGKMDKISGENYRVSVPAGTTQTIIMPRDGYVVIEAVDGTTDVFPESVKITIE